jgi:hypothetical protein
MKGEQQCFVKLVRIRCGNLGRTGTVVNGIVARLAR